MRPYEIVLQPKAWAVLARVSGRKKGRLIKLLDELGENPFRAGDYQQADATGRTHEVSLFDEWLVTHWSDHASREVRVVNLQRVQE